ncbi:pyridoxal kinase PdxY [Pseudohoeflea coraliihabitans]|uniref:Pyridoxal kinase PdxY n=1 Tax=Pseudohoeflea coraliihabitans TaxID=2860393 RepID=A0ABS6WUR4_9HYPH|nr:pyridoxal kinase PdxY [Pseudohoeflea sp. DP4N28-3]MBW3099177.1 pyridoxal kinase PdxY [Pseudohoeflea sp. DP4N28-3]
MTRDDANGARPAVIVISSHVVRGSVGNRAVVFALETLGFPVWAVPTVVLPWHPGHSPATRIVAEPEQFASLLADLSRAHWLPEIGAVITGYLGNVAQVEPVAQLIETVKAGNPQALYLCDPVIGDDAQLYVAEELAAGIRDRLMPLADITTPNLFELSWLTGAPVNDTAASIAAAQELGPARVLVTSALAMMAGSTGTMLVDGDRAMMAEHRLIANPPNGLGDLLAATFLARLIEGKTGEKALQLATGTVFEVLARTARRGADELTIETDADSLRSPMAMVHMRRLITRPPRPRSR